MNLKKLTAGSLAFLMTAGMMLGSVSADEIVINYPTFQVGANSSAPAIAELVNQFNEKYAGQYRIQVEEVPGDENYSDKITVQIASSDALPPVIYGAGQKLLDLALQADAVKDITEDVQADPEWAAMYTDSWADVNCRDGKIYASSMESEMIGYFYNKELFEQAGIDGPAATWDEFFEDLDKLKEAGITPLAMDTAGGAWCTQLLIGAYLASTEEGMEFLKTKYPTDYNNEAMINAMAKAQELYQNYTTLDALGGAYENAANNFFSGNVAIICNGPWMISDFSDESKAEAGFADKVGAAAYPNGFVYDAPIEGMFVTKQSDPALEEAAVAMVQFFTSNESQALALDLAGMVPASTAVEISDDILAKYPLLGEFLSQAGECENRASTLTGNMVPGLEDVWDNELPNLASGADTPEDFCQVLTDFASANPAQ